MLEDLLTAIDVNKPSPSDVLRAVLNRQSSPVITNISGYKVVVYRGKARRIVSEYETKTLQAALGIALLEARTYRLDYIATSISQGQHESETSVSRFVWTDKRGRVHYTIEIRTID